MNNSQETKPYLIDLKRKHRSKGHGFSGSGTIHVHWFSRIMK